MAAQTCFSRPPADAPPGPNSITRLRIVPRELVSSKAAHNMAFWAMQYRPEARDDQNGIYWQDTEPDDLFGQFVDLDPDSGAQALSSNALASPDDLSMPPTLAAPSSIGSASDELDFLSSSSQPSADMLTQMHTAPGVFDTGSGGGGDQQFQGFDFDLPGASISDSDLPRLDGMTLHSPTKKTANGSRPTSPTPPNTARKGGAGKFVNALSSTIKKATKGRGRTAKRADPTMERAMSPGGDADGGTLMNRKTRQQKGIKREETEGMISPPMEHPQMQNQQHLHHQQQQQQQQHAVSMNFVHGMVDDPFVENSRPPMPPRYFSTANTPQESPVAPEMFHNTDPIPQGHGWGGHGHTESWGAGWWDMNIVNQNQEQQQQQQQLIAEHQRQASFNAGMHAQQGEIGYEYGSATVQDPSTAGLMINLSPGRTHQQQQSPIVTTGPGGDLVVNGQTYLPPPIPATEPRPRPPRAKSSGARHLSISPMRKTSRAPSASPTRRNSRQSSGGSISSVRSASGRLPGDMPGTPCSIKKRRSRDVSLTGSGTTTTTTATAVTQQSLGGGGGVGFVNFTPSDGGMLMTGVAPSGSSKTKARREKEAMEKRRKLSEAAMKAVAAAGGDVDKLIEQGFTF